MLKTKERLFLENLINKEVKVFFSQKTMKFVLESWSKKAKLLREGRVEDAKKKYPDISDKLDYFKDVPDKYILWIAKQIKLTLAKTDQDLTNIKDVVLKFDALVQANKMPKKDINQWPDIIELNAAIKQIGNSPSNTQVKKNAKGEAKTIYKDERFTVVQPLSKAASCQYGKGTKWCISATAPNTKNYWNHYNHPAKKGVGDPLEHSSTPDEELYDFDKSTDIQFFFIMDKAPTVHNWGKVAIAVHKNLTEIDAFDAEDNQVSLYKVQTYYPPPVLQATAEASGNQALLGNKHLVEKFLQTIQDSAMTPLKFKNQMGFIYKALSTAQETNYQNGEKDNEEDSLSQAFDTIIAQAPVQFIGLIYIPSGTNQDPVSLRNVGSYYAFEDRLEQLPLEQILAAVEQSYMTYYVKEYDDYWREGDPYLGWLESTKREFSKRELQQLARFTPQYFNDPPFKRSAINLYLKQVAPSLGIPVTYADLGVENSSNTGVFNMFRAYATSENTSNALEALAQVTINPTSRALNSREFYMKRLLSGWHVKPEDIMAIVNLINQGKLNHEILEPLLTDQ